MQLQRRASALDPFLLLAVGVGAIPIVAISILDDIRPQRALVIPNGIFGNIAVTFTATGPGSDYRWAAYASSVDNRTGDGWTREASY